MLSSFFFKCAHLLHSFTLWYIGQQGSLDEVVVWEFKLQDLAVGIYAWSRNDK